jgi:hypothetical protein
LLSKGRFKFTINDFISVLAPFIFWGIILFNTKVYYSDYIKPCSLKSPCVLLVFTTSYDWKGDGFIGYCFDEFMLKTVEVYIKDCKLRTEHSIVINIMLVAGFIYIHYLGYKGFRKLLMRFKD